jgi:hypothetical protein
VVVVLDNQQQQQLHVLGERAAAADPDKIEPFHPLTLVRMAQPQLLLWGQAGAAVQELPVPLVVTALVAAILQSMAPLLLMAVVGVKVERAQLQLVVVQGREQAAQETPLQLQLQRAAPLQQQQTLLVFLGKVLAPQPMLTLPLILLNGVGLLAAAS